jgi:hypothetical protein
MAVQGRTGVPACLVDGWPQHVNSIGQQRRSWITSAAVYPHLARRRQRRLRYPWPRRFVPAAAGRDSWYVYSPESILPQSSSFSIFELLDADNRSISRPSRERERRRGRLGAYYRVKRLLHQERCGDVATTCPGLLACRKSLAVRSTLRRSDSPT